MTRKRMMRGVNVICNGDIEFDSNFLRPLKVMIFWFYMNYSDDDGV